MGYVYDSADVFALADWVKAQVRQKGDELFFTYCPYCRGGGRKDRDTFSVNLKTGTFNCFRASCGKHGHFVELARDLNYKLFDDTERQYRKLPQKQAETKPAAIEYLKSRGIGEDVARRYYITTQKNDDSILVFPFYDENAQLVFVKYRNTKYNGTGNKEWAEKGCKPILFGMAQCRGFERLVITEGQIDSLTLSECGIKNAVSVPTGALGFTWFPACFDWISKFREVVVFGDYEHGKMTLLDDLQKRLTCRILAVRPCDYLGEKDANAILCKYGKEAVVTAVKKAEPPKIENVKDLSTVKAVDINALPKITTNIKEIDKVIGGLIMGQVVLLTGERGNGKSTFLSQLVCEALEQDESVFVYSGELTDYHFKRWLDYQLAGPDNLVENRDQYGEVYYTIMDDVVEKINAWYRGRAYIYDNSYADMSEDAEIETLPETIEKVARQYGTRLVCIDNLMTAMDSAPDADLWRAQSNFVGRLKKIAVKYDIAILLVAHPKKNKNGEFVNDDVAGSADITNKVDVVMNYKRTEQDGEADGKLEITKNRLFGRYAKGENAVRLYFNSGTKRIVSATSGKRVYGWEKHALAEEESLPFEV